MDKKLVQPNNKKTLIIAGACLLAVAILSATALIIVNMLNTKDDDSAQRLEDAKNCVVSAGQKSTSGSFADGSYTPSGASYTQIIAECAEKHSVSYGDLTAEL
ncbi:MAG: hypothetical protein ACK5MU_04010 [Candidatus Saccharimonadales bacterium]